MSDIRPDAGHLRGIPQGGGIRSRFNEWLRNHGRQSRPAEIQVVPVIRPKNIADVLLEALKDKDLTPPQYEGGRIAAVPAIIGTNENTSEGFVEAIRAKNPDGYIIGVGAGTAFSLPYSYPEGVTPKGMILADIDPKVVAVGKLLINTIRESETPEDLVNNFFNLSDEQFQARIQEIIDAEEDPVLKQRLEEAPDNWLAEIFSWKGIAERIRDAAKTLTEHEDLQQVNPFTSGGPRLRDSVDVVIAIVNRFPILKQLVSENNIAMVYADFTNPDFIAAVRDLPEFKTSKNIIYMSNIVDHITRRGRESEKIAVMDSLRAYEDSPQEPIFIDTPESLQWMLRTRSSFPVYQKIDVWKGSEIPREWEKYWEELKAGLLFADEREGV